jgi:hypothetical protein
VIRKLEWAQSLTKANIDRDIHNAFMSLMFASMYTFSVNGRLGGIANAKYGQRDELLTSGHAMTSLFKTSSSYSYQPIVVDYEVARRLLQIYIDCVRPTERFIQLQDRNSPLWINYNGSALNSHAIGTLLKRFFIRECQLQLNSTVLRGLMESYAQELFDRGEISEATRRSVATINGHSEATARRFYVRNNAAFDVCRSRGLFEVDRERSYGAEVAQADIQNASVEDEDFLNLPDLGDEFGEIPSQEIYNPHSQSSSMENVATTAGSQPRSIMSPTSPIGSSNIESPPKVSLSTFQEFPSIANCVPLPLPGASKTIRSPTNNDSHSTVTPQRYPTVADYVPKPLPVWSDLNWGESHPCYLKEQKRIIWTQLEVDYIGNFFDSHSHMKNVAAACLEKIWRDPDAVPIFHRNHITDSGRLRTGLDYWKKQKPCWPNTNILESNDDEN